MSERGEMERRREYGVLKRMSERGEDETRGEVWGGETNEQEGGL